MVVTEQGDGMDISSQRGAYLWVGAVASLLLFAAVASLAYSLGERDVHNGALAIIRSDQRPFKIQPGETGGRVFAHQDLRLYNHFNQEKDRETETKLHAVSIKDNSETPLPRPQASKTSAASEHNQDKDEKSKALFASLMTDEQDGLKMSENILATGRQAVKNIIVDSEQGRSLEARIIPIHRTVPYTKLASVQQATVMNDASSVMRPDKAVSFSPEKSTLPFSDRIANVIENSKNNDMKAYQPTSRKSAALSDNVSRSTKGSGTNFVQLGSWRSEDDLQAAWQSIRKRNLDVLAIYRPRSVQASVGERGVFYRLHVGPFASKNQALNLCQTLQKRGQDCMVY